MEKKFYSLPNVSLRDKIPVPPRKPLPLDDVPMWLQLPYDTKYPLSECSKTAITLTTDELGKSLYHTFPRKDFEVSSSPNPYPETSSYNSLHDPHLRRYFLSPFRYKHLLTKGLVTEDGKVKSHVQEHNHYRMYLYHLWGLEVNQLVRHQMSEERNCFETMLQARNSEDPLFKKFAEKCDRINADEILEEAAMEISQNKKLVDEHGVTPFVRATLQWKIHQGNLQKNYRKHYPAIKQWLSDKTKHYKRLMEIKLNAGRNRDKKLRSRWEKIYESSRVRLERDMKLRELEREKKRTLTEQRYDRVKRLWAENERALKERKKKKTTDLPRSFTYTDPPHHKWITSDSESSPSSKTSEPDMLHTDLDDDQVAKSAFSEEYNTEKVPVTSPEITKIDKVKKEFDDSMEITNTSLQLKDDDKLLKISDRKLTCKVPLKEEKKLRQVVDITKETEEDTRKEEVLKKGNYLKKRGEEPILPVQSMGLEYKEDADNKSIQKLKPQLGFVEQSQLIKFLYGLPDVTKSNKSESEDYSLVTEKADEIPGKTNARNPETTEKLEDLTSYSFNTPLKEDSARSEPVIKKEKLEDSTSHSFKTSLKENSVRSEPVVKREKLEGSTSHSFKTPLKENLAKSETTEKLEDLTSYSFNTPLKEDSARSEPVIKKEKLEDSTSHCFKTSLKENSVRSEPVVKREKLEDSISHSFKTLLKENSTKSETKEKLEDLTSYSFNTPLKEDSARSEPVIKKEKFEDSTSHSFKTSLKENSVRSEPVVKREKLEVSISHSFKTALKENSTKSETTEKLEDLTSYSFNTPLKEDSARSEPVIKKEKLEDSTSHSFKTSLKENSVRSEPVVKREKLEDSISRSFKTLLKENSTKSETTEKLEDLTSYPFNTPLKEDSARSEPVIKKEKLEDSTSHSFKTSLKENSVRSEPVVKRETLEGSISHSFKTPLKENATKFEPVIKKTDEISDKNSASSPEVIKKPEDSNSFRTPLEKILGGYGYEEYDDVWKALDNLYEERKRKFRGIVGLDELKIKQWRNEKNQKELYESTPFSIQHKKSATLEKYPAAHTLDESTLKIYKTGSESKLSYDKSVLKRIFAKQTFDDILIKNEHKIRNVQKLQKMKLGKNISRTVLSPKPEIEQKVKMDHSRSGIYKAKKKMLDADLLILRRKAHFMGKETSKEKVTDLHTPYTTAIKLQKQKNTSPDLSYMESKNTQTHQFINKTTSCGKEDSERVEKYLATLVDDIILEAEVPKIREKKTAAADGIQKIASQLDNKLFSKIKLTQSIKDNTQKTELKFYEKEVATSDSNNFAKSCSAITDSFKIRENDDKESSMSKKTNSENAYFTSRDFERDDIKCGIIEPKDENIEKDSIEEFGPSFIAGDIDKKITAEDASLCRKLTTTDRSNNIKDLQTKQEISEIDNILQKSANRNEESLTDNIQEMTDTYINLQISTPNETMNILDNKDLLHSTKNEDVYESVNQKEIYNYQSAKAPEYFGYLDDTFDDVLKKKQAETFSKFIITGEKHLILPSDIKSIDITDVNENSVSFQPINIVTDIERRRPEAKYTSTVDSHNGTKTNNGQKHELTITKPIIKEITHDDSNNFLLDTNCKTHLLSIASGKLDEKYAFLEQAKGKDHQMKYFQQTESETTAQTQPKKKEKEKAKLPDFDIQQNIASLDEVPSAFIYSNDLTRDVDETLSEHHFHGIKFSKNSPSSDIDDNNAISIQSEEETKSIKDEVPKTETPVKRDLEVISDTKATTREIKDEESILPISDNPKMGAETEVIICPNYESEKQINMHRIQHPPFDSRCSLVTPKSSKRYFEEYSEQADLTSDRTVNHTDESLPGTQTVPYNKDINQNLNRQFSKEEDNLENGFTDNSITANFEIPKSVIDDTNLDEKTLKLFLNESISNITQEFRKKKYSSLTQIEPIADADENGSKDTSGIHKKESNVLASTYRTIRNETLSKNANEEIRTEDSDENHNPSESKTSLSHNNIEQAKIFSEYSIDDEYLDVTGLTEDENRSTDSSENNAYQNFESNGNQDDALETEACKLFFNDQFDSSKPNVKDYKTCTSKYVYAQRNKEIMSIASEKVENIEQYFKTSNIRTTLTNVDEIIIADDTENEIKIIEEKMSKLNL